MICTLIHRGFPPVIAMVRELKCYILICITMPFTNDSVLCLQICARGFSTLQFFLALATQFRKNSNQGRGCGWPCDQQKMTQPGCTKMAISQLLLRVASSNLVGRKSKCYFIIKCSLLISVRLRWRGIRPDAGKTTEK